MDPTMPTGGQRDSFLRRLRKKLSNKTVLFFTLAILASATATGYILFFTGPRPSIVQKLLNKKPTVSPKTEFKNPFSKDTQYVNPFDLSKSPFLSLKKAEK